jgi:hypothetical protein
VNPKSASLTPLTQFANSNLTFKFMRPGTYTINVTTDQGSPVAPLTVTVRAPTIISHSQRTCIVDIDTIPLVSPSGSHTSPPSLSFGYNDTCGATPGITLSFSATSGSGGGGKMRLTQLFTKTVMHGNATCDNSVDASAANPLGPADGASFYDANTTGSVPGNWFDTDSPFQGLVPVAPVYGSPWSETFKAVDFLMYRNSAPGSAWVPVGTMTWGWSGTATAGLRKWFLGQSSATLSAYGPLGTGKNAFPKWSTAVGTGGVGNICFFLL